MDFGAIVFGFLGILVAIIFIAICLGLSSTFWRLVDRRQNR